jgi:hypothetical protein
MAQLMAALGELGGEEGEGDVQEMLEGMMSQLMSKEILYEPLKELDEKVRRLYHFALNIANQFLFSVPRIFRKAF